MTPHDAPLPIPPQLWNLATDAPVKRAVYETRTAEDEALERGALILRRLERQHADAWSSLSSTALLLLHRLCLVHGRIESHSAGLMVRDEIKDIAGRMGLTRRSAYVPLQHLIDRVRFVDRVAGWGSEAHDYEIPMPPPGAEENQESADQVRAENAAASAAQLLSLAARASLASDSAAQVARADSDASLANDTPSAANYRTFPDLLSLSARASLASDSAETANAGLSTEKPGASLAARANASPTSTTTTNVVVGGEPNAELQPDAAEVRKVLEEIGVYANVIPGLLPRCSLWLALAVKHEVVGRPTPGALATWIIEREEKERRFKPGSRSRADAEMRRRGKVADPAPPLNAIRQEIESDREAVRVEQIIAAIDDERLKGLANQVHSKYAGNPIVQNLLSKKSPRLCRLMKMEIAGILAATNP